MTTQYLQAQRGEMNRSIRTHTAILVATTSAILMPALSFSITPSTAGGQAKEHLSHRQVKALIATATTPGDHLRLAAYYRAEASRLRKEAADHHDEERAYANASRYTPKGPPSGWLEHCKKFADSFTQAADEAEALAAAHQRMAEDTQ